MCINKSNNLNAFSPAEAQRGAEKNRDQKKIYMTEFLFWSFNLRTPQGGIELNNLRIRGQGSRGFGQ